MDPLGLWRLRRLILEERPDVLHCHAYYPAACALALRATGISIPVLYTVHASLDRGIQRSDGLVMRVAKACEKVVAVSWKTAESIQRFTNGAVAARVIQNGMDLSRIDLPSSFSPAEKLRSVGIPYGTRVFCSVATLTNQKDHPTLLRAFAELTHQSDDMALLIVGAGQEREALESLARQLRIENSVRFLGKRDDVAELLAISQVFVLASHAEGLPISIIEASCAGLPAVATDVGGVSDLLKLGIDIRLTRPDDASHLTTAMRQAMESYSPLSIAQRKFRSRAIFSIENTAEQYQELYRELFEERYAA
jgi:glycosyltransferase involved in cell wall biosynthesis